MSLGNIVKRIRQIMRNDAGISGDAQRIEQMVWIIFLKVYDAKESVWEFREKDFRSIIPEKLRWRNWAVDNKDGQAPTGEALLKLVNDELFPALQNLEIDETTPASKAIVKAVFEDNNNYMKDGILLRQVINVIDEIDFDEYEDRHAFGEIYESILKELQSAGSAGEFYTPRAATDFIVKMLAPQLGERVADFACGTGGFLTSTLKELEPQVKTVNDRKKFNVSVYGIEKKPLPYLLCVTNMLLHDIDAPQIYHDNSLERDVRSYKPDEKFDVIVMNPPYGGGEKDGVKMNFPSDLRSSETADLFMSVIMYRLKKNGRAAVIVPDGFMFGTDGAKAAIKAKLIGEYNLHTIIRLPHSVFAPYTGITTNVLFFDNTGPTESTWIYRLDMPEGIKHFSKTKPMELKHFDPAVAWWNDRKPLAVDGFDKAREFSATELIDGSYNLDLCGYPHEEEEIKPPLELIADFQQRRGELNAKMDAALKVASNMLDGTSVALQRTSPYAELIQSATALSGVVSALPDAFRKSVLQYAIQGKLVPQDPNDEPASALLERIAEAVAAVKKARKTRKDKPLDSVDFEDAPFEIPDSWEWCRLGVLTSYLHRGKSPVYVESGGYPMFAQKCNQWTGVQLDKCKFCDADKYASFEEDAHLHDYDVVINSTGTGTLGRVGLFRLSDLEPYGFGSITPDSHVTIVRTPHAILNQYLRYFFSTQYMWDWLNEHADGSTKQKELYTSTLASVLIPLPPLAEQKRIVAEVERLLEMGDKIKAVVR